MKLSEKTVVLSGPLSPVVQAIATTLIELGSDLAILTADTKPAERFCANLRDLREAHPDYGRATAILSEPRSAEEAKNDISRAAEVFGSLDIYIDALLLSQNQVFSHPESLEGVESFFDKKLRPSLYMAHGALQFLKGRGKGRMIFLLHEAVQRGSHGEALTSLSQGGLSQLIPVLAKENQEHQVTVNGISMGASEEYLLARYPDAPSVTKALESLKQDYPYAQMVDSYEIANTAAYLASPLSCGITGQVIRVTRGMDLS